MHAFKLFHIREQFEELNHVVALHIDDALALLRQETGTKFERCDEAEALFRVEMSAAPGFWATLETFYLRHAPVA
jgi:hypothetical protein